jgi:hypothetical protein
MMIDHSGVLRAGRRSTWHVTLWFGLRWPLEDKGGIGFSPSIEQPNVGLLQRFQGVLFAHHSHGFSAFSFYLIIIDAFDGLKSSIFSMNVFEST